MTNEDISKVLKEVKTLLKQNAELNEKALILARETTSPSISQVISEMTNKLDRHIETHEEDVRSIKDDIAVLKKSVEPAVAAVDTANGLRRGVVWIAGFLLACGTIYGFFKK